MSQIAISGNAAGTGVLTIASPNTNSSYTATLPTATTTLVGTDATQTLTNKTITGAVMTSMASSVITSGTLQTTTSGTAINFTGIPSWAKRITVMFAGVSTAGTAPVVIQLGTGATPTYTTSGYLGSAANSGHASAPGIINVTNGLPTSYDSQIGRVRQGSIIITTLGSNIWVSQGVLGDSSTTQISWAGGSITLADTLTALRIIASTTANPADAFDLGSINILYE